jgi:transposase InsO family protein
MRFVGINPGVNFVLMGEVRPHPRGEGRRVGEEARSTIVNYERDGSRDFTWPAGAVLRRRWKMVQRRCTRSLWAFSCVASEDTFKHRTMRSKSNASYDLQARQVRISMAAQGEPRENGYAERLMRTIKEEEVELSDYQDFTDAYRQIGQFLEDVYNTKRIHSSLGYLTPLEFEAAWQAQKAEQTSPEAKPFFCPVLLDHHSVSLLPPCLEPQLGAQCSAGIGPRKGVRG